MDRGVSAERRRYLSEIKRRSRSVTALRLGLLLAFFVLWELSASFGAVDAFIVSAPSRMWETFLSLFQSGELWLHLGTSLWETAAGFVLGTLLGTLVAVLLWWSPFLSRVLDPYLVVLNSLPKTA